jgi:glycosyltransferase involved in cell wall biosynthesis
MKILFCSPTRLDRTLGAPKVVIELAEGLRGEGCHCDLIGPEDLGNGLPMGRVDPDRYAEGLRDFLREKAAEYDVVDYDHEYLPFDRSEFPPTTLMVARSVLLHYHFGDIKIPMPKTPRAIAARIVRGFLSRSTWARNRNRADRTAQQADLFVSLNSYDGKALVRHGIAASKIAVVGLGLHPERFVALSRACSNRTGPPTIAFVGTFDYRKGCLDFPRIVSDLYAAIPGAKFRLIGTCGLFQTAAQVLAHFPRRLRPIIEVIPRFAPDELPSLLQPCVAGVFPSYIEGFGFGVLEMLAAGLPVIAYDAPGPPDMLPQRWLAPRGDARHMAGQLIQLLRDPAVLSSESAFARDLAASFTWKRAAEKTLSAYRRARETLLHALPSRVDGQSRPRLEPTSRSVAVEAPTVG